MRVLSLTQEGTGLLPVHNRPIDRRDVGDTMAEVTLKLVHVVCTFASPASMLAIDRIDPQTSRADAQDERIL